MSGHRNKAGTKTALQCFTALSQIRCQKERVKKTLEATFRSYNRVDLAVPWKGELKGRSYDVTESQKVNI